MATNLLELQLPCHAQDELDQYQGEARRTMWSLPPYIGEHFCRLDILFGDSDPQISAHLVSLYGPYGPA
jgi:hypothetical protein